MKAILEGKAAWPDECECGGYFSALHAERSGHESSGRPAYIAGVGRPVNESEQA